METSLFGSHVFGPIKSRRFGNSLGVNLLPEDKKLCNYDCIYCECGSTKNETNLKQQLPESAFVVGELINRVELINDRDIRVDNITFAGNGEPTLYPNFKEIINDVVLVRDIYLPNSKISVLTNATMLHNKGVKEALQKVDTCMFKLDTGTEDMFAKINKPLGGINLEKTIHQIKEFGDKPIIQSMFLKGTVDGILVDNSTEEELEAWITILKDINPSKVVVYTIDRPTAEKGLEKISIEKLKEIAKKVDKAGFVCEVVGA